MAVSRHMDHLETCGIEDGMPLMVFWRRFFLLDLRYLQHARELGNRLYLLYALTLRGIRSRYKQSLIGAAWALLTPAAMTFVFSYVFSRTKLKDSVFYPAPFPIYALCGLTFWTFFTKAVTNASNSVVANMDLVTKVHFPREVLPLSSILTNLVDWALALAMFLLFAFVYSTWLPALAVHFPSVAGAVYQGDYHFSPGLNWVWTPVFMLGLILFAAGISLAAAALQVYFRDISHLLQLVLFLWLFLTPVLYDLRAVAGGRATTLIILNPLTGLLDGIKLSLLMNLPPWENHTIYALTTSLFVFLVGYGFFKHEERYFADVV